MLSWGNGSSCEVLVFWRPSGAWDFKGGLRETPGARWGQGKSPVSHQEAERGFQRLWRWREGSPPQFLVGASRNVTPAIGEGQKLPRRVHSSLGLRGLFSASGSSPRRRHRQASRRAESTGTGSDRAAGLSTGGWLALADPISLLISYHSLHVAPAAYLLFQVLALN